LSANVNPAATAELVTDNRAHPDRSPKAQTMRISQRLATLALAAAALPCFAESSVASMASDSLSVSSAKISDSISNSSQSSSQRDARNAQGDYKVIEVAEVAGRPGMLQLHLQPLAQGEDFLLTLPRQAAANGHVAKDAVVTALQRPYGIEFATGEPHAAFFLALADDWAQELKTSPLTL
jgi:hypothetical protein